MNDNVYNGFSKIKLSKADFENLKNFIQSRFGIKMPDTKKGMVESRLRKRLTQLKIKSYSDYCDYLFSNDGMEDELQNFIDVITTNKTDFFREPNHFTFLTERALPELLTTRGVGIRKNLLAWSSACSRGDEPYTLSMVIYEFARRHPGYDYSILATDISNEVLQKAIRGVYDTTLIEPIPMEYRKKYLLRSKDRSSDRVRIVPELRKKITFRQLNLMDNDFRIRQQMDIIFCRNVIIYFNKETTDRLIKRLCNKLNKGGFLFMGHSELLDCNMLPLVSVAPTVYQKIR